MVPAKQPATYADIEALPEHLTGEIIDGELFVSPRPAPPHARAEGAIHADLSDPFDRGRGGPGGWWLLIEPELRLGAHVLVPDIAGWRRERMPEFPQEAAIALAPDWLCEVLSPATAKLDRGKKLTTYGRQGIEWVWLVDPVLRTVEVYRFRDGWVFGGMFTDDARVRIPPFHAVEVDMSGWWPPRPPGSAAEPPIVWATSAITGP
jgi:Uma2 family endonuclease